MRLTIHSWGLVWLSISKNVACHILQEISNASVDAKLRGIQVTMVCQWWQETTHVSSHHEWEKAWSVAGESVCSKREYYHNLTVMSPLYSYWLHRNILFCVVKSMKWILALHCSHCSLSWKWGQVQGVVELFQTSVTNNGNGRHVEPKPSWQELWDIVLKNRFASARSWVALTWVFAWHPCLWPWYWMDFLSKCKIRFDVPPL